MHKITRKECSNTYRLSATAARSSGRVAATGFAASVVGGCGGRKEGEGEHGEDSEAREHLVRARFAKCKTLGVERGVLGSSEQVRRVFIHRGEEVGAPSIGTQVNQDMFGQRTLCSHCVAELTATSSTP